MNAVERISQIESAGQSVRIKLPCTEFRGSEAIAAGKNPVSVSGNQIARARRGAANQVSDASKGNARAIGNSRSPGDISPEKVALKGVAIA